MNCIHIDSRYFLLLLTKQCRLMGLYEGVIGLIGADPPGFGKGRI